MKRTTRIAAGATAASAIAIAGVVGVVTGASADTTVSPSVTTTTDSSNGTATRPARPDPATVPYVGVHLRLTTDGLVVRSLVPGGPAETAGIKAGDIIVSVNGVAVTERALIRNAFERVSPGDKVTVVVDRDGTSTSITITTGSQADRPAAADIPYLGAHPERPMDGTGTPPTSFTVGVVDAGSPAEAAGLKVGDVITSVNGTAIAEPRDAMDVIRDLAPGDTVSLGVTRDGATLTLTVTLGSQADAPDRPRGPRGGFAGGMGGGMGDQVRDRMGDRMGGGMGGGMGGLHDGQPLATDSTGTTGGANAVANVGGGQNL